MSATLICGKCHAEWTVTSNELTAADTTCPKCPQFVVSVGKTVMHNVYMAHPMDRATRQHFETWCRCFFRSDAEVDVATPYLLGVYARDSERYERDGWHVLLRDAELLHGNCFWLHERPVWGAVDPKLIDKMWEAVDPKLIGKNATKVKR